MDVYILTLYFSISHTKIYSAADIYIHVQILFEVIQFYIMEENFNILKNFCSSQMFM